MARICIVGASPRSLLNFRGELIKKFVGLGHEVLAIAGGATAGEISLIEALGVRYLDVPVIRTSINPFVDLKTMRFYRQVFISEKPDFVLSYTIKPVVWGGIALRSYSPPHFTALITGLGYAFEGQGFKRALLRLIVSMLYRFSLQRADKVIFQNHDDLAYFVDRQIVAKEKTYVVSGSGVPLDHFVQKPLPLSEINFLMVARLLKEKGVYQFVEAARQVKLRFPAVRFRLLGGIDPSPDGVNRQVVDAWLEEGCIEYLGETTDVRPFLAEAHVFVLPSFYREGLPRTILEAMATGRAILTTNNVGCRDPIVEGENGWLVPVRNSEALAERMFWFIDHPESLQGMGQASRRLAEDIYDVHKVNSRMLKIMGL